MKRNTILALLLICFVSDAKSANAGEQGPVYPEYKANETLIFRSAPVTWVEGEGIMENRDKYGVTHYRIPDIAKLPDGRLLVTVVCRLDTSGDGATSTSFFALSDDEGKTWEKIAFNTDTDTWKKQKNGEEYDKTKKRPASDFPMTERTQETQVVWHAELKRFVAIFLTEGAVHITTSLDLKKWTEPYRAPINVPELSIYWPSPASLQLDNDGRLLFTITGHATDPDTKRGAHLVWTSDLKNFEVSTPMPAEGNETAVIPVGDDEYFVSTRISPTRLNMYYNRKTREWTEPVPFPAPCTWRCTVDIVAAKDGKALYFVTPIEGRTQGRVYKSLDKGKTWVEEKVITNSDEGHFGYSAMVRLDNGDIGIVAERARNKSNSDRRCLSDIVFHRVEIDK